MILSIKEISEKYNIMGYGVIHIGSHHGLEYIDYKIANIDRMIFFEPIKSNFEGLFHTVCGDPNVMIYNLALGNETGVKKMFVEKANCGMSCSILEPKEHLEMYPWITFNDIEEVKIDKLDNIEFDRKLYNVLNIDVQGFELEVLKGSVNTLNSIQAIYIEVNAIEMYKGCALEPEITAFLQLYGFTKIKDNIDNNGRWGDALYLKL